MKVLIVSLIVSVISLIAWMLVLVAMLRLWYAELTEEQEERLDRRLHCYAVVAVTAQVLQCVGIVIEHLQ